MSDPETIPAPITWHVDGWQSPARWPIPPGASPTAMPLGEIVESARLAGFIDARPDGNMLAIGMHENDPRRFPERKARIVLVENS